MAISTWSMLTGRAAVWSGKRDTQTCLFVCLAHHYVTLSTLRPTYIHIRMYVYGGGEGASTEQKGCTASEGMRVPQSFRRNPQSPRDARDAIHSALFG